jgi:hypothetical protein
MTFGPSDTYFSFLPVEFDLPSNPEEQRKYVNERNRLTASILNTKSNGNYQKTVLLNGDQWFTSIVNGQTIPKYGFRMTFDLVEMNGAPIPPGVTALPPLIPIPIPPTYPKNILGITNPLPSFGSGTIPGPIYVFTGTDFNVRFDNTVPANQVITITNNTGVNLTQCYWVFNFLRQ